MKKIETKHIINAYRKFKSKVYYENTFLFDRKLLAEFECSEDGKELTYKEMYEKFEKIAAQINSGKLHVKENDVGCIVLPKKVEPSNDCASEQGLKIINNINSDGKILVKRPLCVIDTTVEIHIISTLWVLLFGNRIQKSYEKHNYGNMLIEKVDENSEGLRLFKPYFFNYQNWRDKAIKKVKEEIKEGNNVVLLNLDVKDYYYSVSISLQDYREITSDTYSPKQANESIESILSEFLFRVAEVYDDKLKDLQLGLSAQEKRKDEMKAKKLNLPIGLLSSAIIANHYLKDFDELVLKKLSPSYYGRYVDDMLIVKKIHRHQNDCFEAKSAIRKELKKILKFPNEASDKDENSPTLRRDKKNGRKTYKHLKVQLEKMKVYYFAAKEQTALIEKFERELIRNQNAFRYFNDDRESSFLEAAYSMNYAGSKNKISSINSFTPNSFGISSYLAKIIYSALSFEDKPNERLAKDILSFFKGHKAIEFYSYWEKALTYFVITNDLDSFNKLFNNINESINYTISRIENSSMPESTSSNKEQKEYDIDTENNRNYQTSTTALRLSLGIHLDNSVALSLALNMNFEFKESKESKVYNIAKRFINSNLLRHKYVALPLTNFLESSRGKYNFSKSNYFRLTDLIKKVNPDKKKSRNNTDEMIRENAFYFSPRFIHFDEVVAFYLWMTLLDRQKDTPETLDKAYLEESFRIFYQFNYSRRPWDEDSGIDSDERYEKIKNSYFKEVSIQIEKNNEENNNKHNSITTMSFNDINSRDNNRIKIGVANMVVNEKEIHKSLLGKPIMTQGKKKKLFTIFDQAISAKNIDALVLPEACIPYQWLNLFCSKVKNEKMLMIFGFEYLVVDDTAYNLLANLIPIQVKDEDSDQSFFSAVIPLIRLKNHYAPSEREEIKGHHLCIPKIGKSLYYLVIWRNIHFTTFNCFELTNIQDRAAFRSLVDVIFACEYNPDTNYFSNIIESTSRDIHCYMIQANSSNYGDSRITQPTKTEAKDILRIKGGRNPTVLAEYIDIDKLREFQYKAWNLQLNSKEFKVTPPGFCRKNIARRLRIEINPKKD